MNVKNVNFPHLKCCLTGISDMMFFFLRIVVLVVKVLPLRQLKKENIMGVNVVLLQHSTIKPNSYEKKLIWYIWCDQLSVVCYELLKPNVTRAVYLTTSTTTPDTTKLFFGQSLLGHTIRSPTPLANIDFFQKIDL